MYIHIHICDFPYRDSPTNTCHRLDASKPFSFRTKYSPASCAEQHPGGSPFPHSEEVSTASSHFVRPITFVVDVFSGQPTQVRTHSSESAGHHPAES